VEAAACVHPHPPGPTYFRRQPEKTALYRVMQEHLLTFEQQWTDEASGRTLPKFVTDELHGFMSCGILGRGFAHLFCESCGEHHVVAFSCKARATASTYKALLASPPTTNPAGSVCAGISCGPPWPTTG
jgi:hypothetical protein